jgi:site-specific DNA-methyltransferase (cytosine-N4-specific)
VNSESPTAALLTGDAVQVMRTLPAGSVDWLVTSPPYWRLRDYGTGHWTGGADDCTHQVGPAGTCPFCGAVWTDLQCGREATTDENVDHLRQVFHGAERLLAPTGTAWLNLGDSYSANSDGYRCARPGQHRQPRYRPPADVPHKNLVGLPWRVAFALQTDGWILRNAMVWHKPNAAPFPVRDWLSNRHEMLFLLVRQPRYHFDLDAVRQPYTGDRPLSRHAHHGGSKPHTARGAWPSHPRPPGRNPGDVWTIPVTPQRNRSHPAAWPVQLLLRCIRAGCPPGGMVLDPFSGTGTTGVAALQSGRSYTGIDLNPDFTATAKNVLGRQPTVKDPSGEHLGQQREDRLGP